MQEAEEVGFGISQNDSKYGVWLQDTWKSHGPLGLKLVGGLNFTGIFGPFMWEDGMMILIGSKTFFRELKPTSQKGCLYADVLDWSGSALDLRLTRLTMSSTSPQHHQGLFDLGVLCFFDPPCFSDPRTGFFDPLFFLDPFACFPIFLFLRPPNQVPKHPSLFFSTAVKCTTPECW